MPILRDSLRRAYWAMVPWLYARTNFKLFLRVALSDVDKQVARVAAATDLFSSMVQPVPIRAPFGRSMLVVAPHQDDEMIGCGGVLALQVQAGAEAYIVVLADGGADEGATGMTRQDLVALRNSESECAAAKLGIAPPRLFGFPDLAAEEEAAADGLRRVILERRADAIFVPFFLDPHPDHWTANRILAKALRGVDFPVRVFGYEVWSLSIANVIAVIDSVIEQKMELLACFPFANQAADYAHNTRGMNMYRSRLLAGKCKYAECFFEVPKKEYIKLIRELSEKWGVGTGEMGASSVAQSGL